MQEMLVWFLGREDPMEKEMATHSSSVSSSLDSFVWTHPIRFLFWVAGGLLPASSYLKVGTEDRALGYFLEVVERFCVPIMEVVILVFTFIKAQLMIQ